MSAIGPWNRQGLRRKIGAAVLSAQEHLKDYVGAPPEAVVPEIIAALLSLAAHVSKGNTDMSREQFLTACEVAADEEWPKGFSK